MTELIFRYVGSEAEAAGAIYAALPEARTAFLLNQYGIIRLDEGDIEKFRALNFLIYIEAAQSLYYSAWKTEADFSEISEAYHNLSSACFPMGDERARLDGRGVLLCVVDSGIDYRNPEFLTANGRTRILAYWDQSAAGTFQYQDAPDSPQQTEGDPSSDHPDSTDFPQPAERDPSSDHPDIADPPQHTEGDPSSDHPDSTTSRKKSAAVNPEQRYLSGTVYTESGINEAIAAGTREGASLVPAADTSGHGTAVASVCGGSAIGAAPGASFLVVKLGTPPAGGFPRTSELMQGIDFCVRESIRLGMPAVINLSFGNSYGSHLGTSLVETYIDSLDGVGKTVFVTGTGNEGAAGGHKAIHSGSSETVSLSVAESTPDLNIQIWKNYADVLEIRLVAPAGDTFVFHEGTSGSYLSGSPSEPAAFAARINYVWHLPSYYQAAQELYLALEPAGDSRYIQPGIWRIRFTPVHVTDGEVHLWLPGESARGTRTAFPEPTPFGTFTIPSTASKIISVGAYRASNDSYADFSGRGFEEYLPRTCKPDLAAPGTDVLCAMPGGGYFTQSGTSLAAPFVSGACALLMQWGIVLGHDSHLYGEKVKAYLKRGAKPLPAFREYPNPYVGYGKLCVRDSIPAT